MRMRMPGVACSLQSKQRSREANEGLHSEPRKLSVENSSLWSVCFCLCVCESQLRRECMVVAAGQCTCEWLALFHGWCDGLVVAHSAQPPTNDVAVTFSPSPSIRRSLLSTGLSPHSTPNTPSSSNCQQLASILTRGTPPRRERCDGCHRPNHSATAMPTRTPPSSTTRHQCTAVAPCSSRTVLHSATSGIHGAPAPATQPLCHSTATDCTAFS